MAKIEAIIIGEQVLLPREDLERLVAIARRSEEIDLRYYQTDISTKDVMLMAEQGKSFEFWRDEGENIYTPQDGKPA